MIERKICHRCFNPFRAVRDEQFHCNACDSRLASSDPPRAANPRTLFLTPAEREMLGVQRVRV